LAENEKGAGELPGLDEAVSGARSAGPGGKGPGYYEWAMIGIQPENHFLLLRRPVREEKEEQGDPAGSGREQPGNNDANDPAGRVKDEGITFCLCYVPPGSPIKPALPDLILMTGRRWGAEETMATAKGPVGWDENQFRKWESMNHHRLSPAFRNWVLTGQ
jgi:hypothetical protein